MCIRVLQIVLAIPGIWLIFAGVLPDEFVGFKLKKRFPFRPDQGKLYGLLLISPFPISLLAALILQMLFGEDGSLYGIIAETIITIVVAIAALIIAWIVYEPIDEESDVPDEFFPRV
jgi:hypothetical protein